MSGDFYDRVARKLGSNFSDLLHAKRIMEYPGGNPEELFEQKLIKLGGQDKVALDLGCGDGSFTFKMASHFQDIIGIDTSEERLKLAYAEQQAQGNTNVRFEKQNAEQMTFADNTFDVVYSRRGPSPYRECYRITKPGGYFVMISIGERDAWDLKQFFGRGQGFRVWERSALEEAEEGLQREGFVVLDGLNVSFDEYFASYQDLELFLQGVPIFEDFDPEKDREPLEAYAAAFRTDKGIHLPRHRYIVVALKPIDEM